MASLRALNSRQSVLQRADGSAHWQQGHTEVLCAVYGPREAPKKFEQMDKADLTVAVHPASGVHLPSHTKLETFLKAVYSHALLLSLHPRTNISIVAQIMNDDGCLSAAALNSATLALIDAGIAMKTLVIGVEAVILNNGEILVDPSLEQTTSDLQKLVKSRMIFAFDSEGNIVSETSMVETGDEIDEKRYWAARQVSKEAASKLLQFMKLTTSAKVLYECRGSAL